MPVSGNFCPLHHGHLRLLHVTKLGQETGAAVSCVAGYLKIWRNDFSLLIVVESHIVAMRFPVTLTLTSIRPRMLAHTVLSDTPHIATSSQGTVTIGQAGQESRVPVPLL